MASFNKNYYYNPSNKNVYSFIVPDLRYLTVEEIKEALIALDNF